MDISFNYIHRGLPYRYTSPVEYTDVFFLSYRKSSSNSWTVKITYILLYIFTYVVFRFLIVVVVGVVWTKELVPVKRVPCKRLQTYMKPNQDDRRSTYLWFLWQVVGCYVSSCRCFWWTEFYRYYSLTLLDEI